MTETLLSTAQTVQPGLDSQQILIIGISTLWVCIMAMALYIRSIHHKHTKEQNSNIEKVTLAMTSSTNAIENNTKIVDKVFDYITKVSK